MALTGEDAYFHHQAAATQDTVADSGLGFHENSHFVLYDPAGSAGAVFSMGVYPNVGIMFGYGCISCDGRQYNLRVSRSLSEDRWSMNVGPMTYEILQPLERYRLVARPNPSGVVAELEFRATAKPGLVDNSRRPSQVQFNQFGRMSGWLELPGRRLEVRDWVAENCRWWMQGPGTFPGLVAPPEAPPGLAIWSPLDFGDFRIWMEHNELPGGETVLHDAEVIYGDGSHRVKVNRLEHHLEFDSGTVLLRGGDVRLHLETGGTLNVRLGKPTGILSLMGAGFTGDERYRQGQYRGAQSVAHEMWDFNAAPPNAAQGLFLDHFLEAECDGRKGHGTVELMLVNYARYGIGPG